MLTGKELGEAIEAARIAKGVSKKKLADDFGVAPPSVQGWVKYGRIDKGKLFQLIEYFKDDVKPTHWGISADQAKLVSGGDSWVMPILAETKVIAGGAARSFRIKEAGGMNALIKDIVTKASFTAVLKGVADELPGLDRDSAAELAETFMGFQQHPEKVLTLFVAIAEAASVGALDTDELDAFITLIRKRRNEKVHGSVPAKG
ncbi:helix-turn-helix domain-containing protein [Pseudomonas putida]|uniref:helix-turn-helix domain-containing protein n=1 Tax=Pseudomonas putida TaxID=303 RepID=UPI0007BA0CAB|nr:helix-turn-helix domain-containing protein [Pseudomonas putida]